MAPNRSRQKLDIPFTSDEEIATMVEQFEHCTWPYERWTHRAHLAVGLVYVRSLPFDAALNRARHHINLYNKMCGDPEGYHETVTILFLRKIVAHASQEGPGRPMFELVDDLAGRCTVAWLYGYYSQEHLWSEAAKCAWVEPDVRPLDF